MNKVIKRIEVDGVRECCSGRKCPALLEMDNGDIYMIGEDITEEFIANSEYHEYVDSNERVVRIPRRIILNAKKEIS